MKVIVQTFTMKFLEQIQNRALHFKVHWDGYEFGRPRTILHNMVILMPS